MVPVSPVFVVVNLDTAASVTSYVAPSGSLVILTFSPFFSSIVPPEAIVPVSSPFS